MRQLGEARAWQYIKEMKRIGDGPRKGLLALSSACLLRCVLVFLLGLAAEIHGDEAGNLEPHRYIAYRSAGKLEIDGRLDEPGWQRVSWTDEFQDIEGVSSENPEFRTRCKMLWDDTHFYVAADLQDRHVWATLKERDATIYHDNDFEIYIDPDGDTHEYYEVEINALGTILDQLLTKPYRDGGSAVMAWDIAGLKSAVHIWGTLNNPLDEDEGWTVEIALPWAVLKECAHRLVPPRPGNQWRVNFSRVQWEVGEGGRSGKSADSRSQTWSWSPQGANTMHHPERWGYVQFSADLAGGGPSAFPLPRQSEALRLLREIYEQQRRYHDENGRYASDLDSLGIKHRLLKDYLWPPIIRATDRWFEAYLEEVEDLDRDGEIDRWYIRQDSRTWKE